MSDTPTTPAPATNAETEAALAKLAAFGKDKADHKRSGGIAGAVLLLVCVVLLAAVGGLAWLQYAQMDELTALRNDYTALQQLTAGSTNQFAALQENQDELSATVQQTLQQELGAANSGLATQAEQLTALASELAATRLRVNTMDAGGSPLAEAEVLLRFAQQRLLLARDTVTALALLQSADELLRGIDDPQIYAVREALARDVAAVQALPVVDVPGLYAQLGAQAARIDSFAVVSAAAAQDFVVTPNAEEATEAGGWWSGITQSLSEYFVVTRGTEAVMPQLGTEEQFLIRALVQLRIEQARLALLRTEPQLYQAALDAALATSRQWLRSEDGSAEDFVTTLETLRDTPIVTEMPGVEQTLSLLRLLPGSTSAAPSAEPVPARPGAQP